MKMTNYASFISQRALLSRFSLVFLILLFLASFGAYPLSAEDNNNTAPVEEPATTSSTEVEQPVTAETVTEEPTLEPSVEQTPAETEQAEPALEPTADPVSEEPVNDTAIPADSTAENGEPTEGPTDSTGVLEQIEALSDAGDSTAVDSTTAIGDDTTSVETVTADTAGIPEEISQDSGLIDSTAYYLGVNNLPGPQRKLWMSVLARAGDEPDYKPLLEEGGLICSKIGDLIRTLGGTTPEPGRPNYEQYLAIREQFLKSLDDVIVGVIISFPDEFIVEVRDQYSGTKDELFDSIRVAQQMLLEDGSRLIEDQRNDPFFLKYPHRRNVIAHLYFRLTELEYQEAESRLAEEYEKFNLLLEEVAETDPDSARRLMEQMPTADYSHVIDMYNRIVVEFPTSDYADDALYNLAVMKSQSNNPDDRASANQLFENFLYTYTESSYTLNVLRRIALYHFSPPVNDLERAMTYYKKIETDFADSTQYYIEALYFLGWCYYRNSEMANAVEYFARALDKAHSVEGSDRIKAMQFAEESIHYIGIAFSVDSREWDDSGLSGVDRMIQWLESDSNRLNLYGRECLVQLGDILNIETGRYREAVVAYQKIIDLFPTDPMAPVIMGKLVDLYQTGKVYDPDLQHEMKIKYFDAFNPDTDWWAKNEDIKLRREVSIFLEQFLDLYIDETRVLAYQGEGLTAEQKQRYFEVAEKYGRQYLRFWPEGPNVYKVNYNFATDLKTLKRNDEAMREFWQVATKYPDTTKKQISEETLIQLALDFYEKEKAGQIYVSPAGEILPADQKPEVPPEIVVWPALADDVMATIQAEREAIDKLLADTTLSDSARTRLENMKPAEREPFLGSEAMILAGFDLYIVDFPETENTQTMLYRAGEVLYGHKYYREARPYLVWLIDKYPQNPSIESAWAMVLEGHFACWEWEDVERVAELISNTDVTPELKANAHKRRAAAVFSNAEDLKTKQDLRKAADEYVRLAKLAPEVDYADVSLWKGALTYIQIKEFGLANETFLYLVDTYPKSEWADKALNNVAYIQTHELKQNVAAAQTHERLVDAYPESQFVQESLREASYLFDAASRDLETHGAGAKQFHADVIRINEKYIKMFPDAEDASDKLFDNARHYLETDNFDAATEIYQRFAAKYPDHELSVRAKFETASYYHKRGDISAAKRDFEATVATTDRLVAKGVVVWPGYSAKALRVLLDWEQEEYNRLRFRPPVESVRDQKLQKRNWRNTIFDKHKKLITLGQKEGYKSLYQIGLLDEELAEAFYDQPKPPIASDSLRQAFLSDSVIAPASDYNDFAISEFREALKSLRDIAINLKQAAGDKRKDVARLNDLVLAYQKSQNPDEQATPQAETTEDSTATAPVDENPANGTDTTGTVPDEALDVASGDSISTVSADSTLAQEPTALPEGVDSTVTAEAPVPVDSTTIAPVLLTEFNLPDSLKKLNDLQKVIVELDSAIVEAEFWINECKTHIPEVAARNAEYFIPYWEDVMRFKMDEKAINDLVRLGLPRIEVEMIARQIALKSRSWVTHEAIAGYLNAQMVAQSVDLGEEWRPKFERMATSRADTMLVALGRQVSLARERTDHYSRMYADVLPRGEDARSKEGKYADEYPDLILTQMANCSSYVADYAEAFGGVMDTLNNFKNLPFGYMDELKDRTLQYILEQYEYMDGLSKDADDRRLKVANLFKETGQVQYNDATFGYADISAFGNEYKIAILEIGLNLRKKYNIPGMAGITILRNLVDLNPEKYASLVGITTQSFSVVTTTDWKIWYQEETDFFNPGFDDSQWSSAKQSNYPKTAPVKALGMGGFDEPDSTTSAESTPMVPVNISYFDSLFAVPIWYNVPPAGAPVVLPELPDTNAVDESAIRARIVAENPPTVPVTPSVEETPVGEPEAPVTEPVVPETEEANIDQDSTVTVAEVSDSTTAEPVPETVAVDTASDTATADSSLPVEEAVATVNIDSLVAVEVAKERAKLVQRYNQVVAERERLASQTAGSDEEYQTWMAPDPFGERPFWFRYQFDIQDRPSAGKLKITADDNYKVWINGEYISEDKADSIDYYLFDELNVGAYLKEGKNCIAVWAVDVDTTGHGILAALVYETIADMNTALDRLVEAELQHQQRQAETRLQAQEAALEKKTYREPTGEELYELRYNEKAKLR